MNLGHWVRFLAVGFTKQFAIWFLPSGRYPESNSSSWPGFLWGFYGLEFPSNVHDSYKRKNILLYGLGWSAFLFIFLRPSKVLLRLQGEVFGKYSDFNVNRINWMQAASCKYLSESLSEMDNAFYPLKGSSVRTSHKGEISHILHFLS